MRAISSVMRTSESRPELVPPVFFRDHATEEAQLAHLAHQVLAKAVLLVILVGRGRYFVSPLSPRIFGPFPE
ncbi:MAG: hypothetical protein A3G20_02580 [Acidobacteria bacterium RIFCSPLOWO2_12_FULL_59_11]|nr:MAG: hypothetical protein A3G20_02580 [Acidobacteria bacterium RIFCSPLOWO2_12_FULL_59_11]